MAGSGDYVCADADRRRQLTVEQGLLNGINDVEVDRGNEGVPAGRTILVHCLRPLPERIDPGRVTLRPLHQSANRPVSIAWAFRATALAEAHQADPTSVTAADVTRFGGRTARDDVLVVRLARPGDPAPYRLILTIPGFDPRLADATVSLDLGSGDDIDCATTPSCPPASSVEPVIDYLQRDYASLRQMLLDRLSVITPAWTDRNPADLGVMLVEVFAYLGDYLAAAQDAVTAEAYLGTARQRISVTRHARLLDYTVHQGATARVWLVLTVEEDTSAGYWRRASCLPDPDGPDALLPAGWEVRSPDGQSRSSQWDAAAAGRAE